MAIRAPDGANKDELSLAVVLVATLIIVIVGGFQLLNF